MTRKFMSHYRRAYTTGGTYFFTVVAYRRRPILCDEPIRDALRAAIKYTQERYPFTIDAMVLMPDHLHCLWTLPSDDADYSTRWRIIKRRTSVACSEHYKQPEQLTESKKKYRESTIWQRRFLEHQIRDLPDLNNHTNYIHYNPVKHGLCQHPLDWPWSSFHRYMRNETYQANWSQDNLATDITNAEMFDVS
jgi:putative transposase